MGYWGSKVGARLICGFSMHYTSHVFTYYGKLVILNIYLFIWCFTSHWYLSFSFTVTRGWKGRGNQYIQLLNVLCFKPVINKEINEGSFQCSEVFKI